MPSKERRVFGWAYPAGAENDPRAPWNLDEDGDEIRDEVEFDVWMEDGRVYEDSRPCAARWCGSYQIGRDTDPQDAEDDIEAVFIAPAFLAGAWTWKVGDCHNPWRSVEGWGLADDDVLPIALAALYRLRAEQAQEAAERRCRYTADELLLKEWDRGGR